jgi:hypothetical protein
MEMLKFIGIQRGGYKAVNRISRIVMENQVSLLMLGREKTEIII